MGKPTIMAKQQRDGRKKSEKPKTGKTGTRKKAGRIVKQKENIDFKKERSSSNKEEQSFGRTRSTGRSQSKTTTDRSPQRRGSDDAGRPRRNSEKKDFTPRPRRSDDYANDKNKSERLPFRRSSDEVGSEKRENSSPSRSAGGFRDDKRKTERTSRPNKKEGYGKDNKRGDYPPRKTRLDSTSSEERKPQRKFEGFSEKRSDKKYSDDRRVKKQGDFFKTHEHKEGRKNTQKGDLVRLNKFISNAGYCSRREADTLISAGSVTVDGVVITELGYKVSPTSLIKIDNQAIKLEKLQYLLLNKPKDIITTCDDPQGRRTVIDLIKGACRERVYPVGRLDRNTTGLLILTNDGEFAKKVAHPSSRIKKLYEVTLNKNLSQEHMTEISKGVMLDDTFVDVDDIDYAVSGKTKSVIGIELHSGKYHVVKRIFEKFGYVVTKLDRTKIDILTKKDLPRGRWRFLTETEIQLLKRM